jgi:hypothetical protein
MVLSIAQREVETTESSELKETVAHLVMRENLLRCFHATDLAHEAQPIVRPVASLLSDLLEVLDHRVVELTLRERSLAWVVGLRRCLLLHQPLSSLLDSMWWTGHYGSRTLFGHAEPSTAHNVVMSWTGVTVAAIFIGLAIFVVAVIRWEIPRWKRGLQVRMTLLQMAEQKTVEDQAASKPPRLVSPDGLWWWDGQRWLPTEFQRQQPLRS